MKTASDDEEIRLLQSACVFFKHVLDQFSFAVTTELGLRVAGSEVKYELHADDDLRDTARAMQELFESGVEWLKLANQFETGNIETKNFNSVCYKSGVRRRSNKRSCAFVDIVEGRLA